MPQQTWALIISGSSYKYYHHLNGFGYKKMHVSKTMQIKPKTVDEYIKILPQLQTDAVKAVRSAILEAGPKLTEMISYGMPAYKLNGKRLMYFAVFKHHLGFYALPMGINPFRKELAKYKMGEGSVQFPLSKPMPVGLIKKIVKAKYKANNHQENYAK